MIEDSRSLSQIPKIWQTDADRLVPYSLLTTGLISVYKNITKHFQFIVVDFSCALKLSMPLQCFQQ